MESFESKVHGPIKSGQLSKEDRVNISFLKYFWLASQLTGPSTDNIPKFLRSIDVLTNFTENELRILSQFFHLRSFEDGEMIFEQGQIGIGFYFVLTGHIELWTRNAEDQKGESLLMTLDRGEYFGELALLQETSFRSASAISQGPCQLLGFFKPDLEEIIDIYPVVGAKFLQAVANILANRLHLITSEYKIIQNKLQKLTSGEAIKEAKS